MVQRRFVIIGDGAAGLSAAEELRENDPVASIGVFTEEPTPSYFRAALTNYLLGELREDQLWINPPNFFETQGIRRAFARVVRVDPARGELWDSSSAEPIPFDALLVASGAHPRFARNPGTGEPLATATKLVAADQAVYHDPACPSAIVLPVMPRQA